MSVGPAPPQAQPEGMQFCKESHILAVFIELYHKL